MKNSQTALDELSHENRDPALDEVSCGSNAPSVTSMGAGDSSKEGTAKSFLTEQITKRETKVVFRLRLLVILVLLAAACAVSIVVLRITRAGEIEEFESQYIGAAAKIADSFESIVRKMGAISGLGVAYSAQTADDEDQVWPFVKLDYFQQRAGNSRLLSGALMVSVSPVVMPGQLRQWEEYVNGPASSWIHDSYDFQAKNGGANDFEDEDNIAKSVLSNKTVDPMHYFDEYGQSHPENKTGLFLPIWQQSPLLKTRYINENVFSRPNVSDVVKRVIFREVAVLGRFMMGPAGNSSHPNPTTALLATLQSIEAKVATPYDGDPCARMYIPVFNHLNDTKRSAVAVMTSIIQWRRYFTGILPPNVKGVRVVLENTCDGNFTYHLNGPEADVIGPGEQIDSAFTKYRQVADFDVELFNDGTSSGVEVDHEGCMYRVKVYPTQQFYDEYVTNSPILITTAIASVFLFSMLMFGCYDRLVERRQTIVLNKAMQSTAIVNSLFPKNVQDRLMEGAQNDLEKALPSNKNRLKGFINNGNESKDLETTTIADLFPHCTVFFGDIQGFTAWSSTRDPEQVFVLLQNIYKAFDNLAKRRKVFKVETIGDCYMAVTGLPEPMESHAVVMSRFAWDCINKMNEVTRELERSLGPDTAMLSMRIGIHSGQVTAGVLRGDRARFQLFGDTVNTASRMESTGQAGKIHASEQVVAELKKAGKVHWVTKRKDAISAKGKGTLQTFWIQPKNRQGTSVTSDDDTRFSSSVGPEGDQDDLVVEKPLNHSLIDWMVDTILDDIRKLLFMYDQYGIKQTPEAPVYHTPEGKTCMDEVLPVIEMPKFHKKMTALTESNYSHMEIDGNVVESLRAFVTLISQSYRNNPFHNFEHACHVTMSVRKLLKRICEPDISNSDREDIKDNKELAAHLHDYTHGLHNDALAALAVTFSALIHDVDHQGVSNQQLGKEFPDLAERYHNKSLAEQNSLELAWDILMQDQFDELRACLFPTNVELLRFRQLIVNIVLATDIFDKELNDLRKNRWERAFAEETTEIPSSSSSVERSKQATEDQEEDGSQETNEEESNLRATIVLEHIIQASDVSHTMQHWQVYQKWNASLFLELSTAHQAGRLAKDPAEFWYQGEMGFFDNYVIPLAKKLDQCGVFGVSSDEYLHYAVQNRSEWEQCGVEIVEELKKKRPRAAKGETQRLQQQDVTASA